VLKEANELEKLRIDLESARERLAVLEEDLGLKKGAKPQTDEATKGGIVYVNAPQPGIVTLIDKRPGDFVAGGGVSATTDMGSANDRMVMTIADMSSLTVRTRVLEADLRYVQKNLPVNVKLDAYPDAKYTGVVTHIGGQGRTDSKAGYTYFDVDVSDDQKDGRVLPEMNATIELIFAKKDDTLVLPLSAVAIFPDKAVIRQADDSEQGYAEKPVTVGIVNETDAEILTGLAAGDKVLEIDFATFQLEDGEDAAKGGTGKRKGKT
jgi:HlyD family secretion protein